jgi:hypothetical protein
VGLLTVPETVKVLKGARPKLQRVNVPSSVRGVFALAAVGAMAGFAVSGLFSAVGPNFLVHVLDETSPALAGVVVFVTFGASAVAQIGFMKAAVRPSLLCGYLALAVSMAILIVSLVAESLRGLLVASAVSGAGQGVLFAKGIAAIAAKVEPDRKAEATSAYFIVAYLAISVPIIAVGIAASAWGLTTASVVFSSVIGLIAVTTLIGLLLRPRSAT